MGAHTRVAKGSESHHDRPRSARKGSLEHGSEDTSHGFRLGVNRSWASKWYEDKNYALWLHEDQKLRKAIKKKFAHAGIAAIDIERAASKAKVVIHTSRPGIIIG